MTSTMPWRPVYLGKWRHDAEIVMARFRRTWCRMEARQRRRAHEELYPFDLGGES